MIREALQNSVDAASPGNGVEVKLRYRVLGGEQLEQFRTLAFSDLPPGVAEQEDVEAETPRSLRSVLGEE
ncbi:hypothetical protein LZ189_13265, partial [Rhodovulum sulfidophilum]|nr:hypothetical protein [Rhodovulum sulfidophilum]